MFWIISPALSFFIMELKEGLSLESEGGGVGGGGKVGVRGRVSKWLTPHSTLVECLCTDSLISSFIHLFNQYLLPTVPWEQF